MKKSIKVIIVMIAAVMLAGCEVGEGELMKTKTGHLMYLGWRSRRCTPTPSSRTAGS